MRASRSTARVSRSAMDSAGLPAFSTVSLTSVSRSPMVCKVVSTCVSDEAAVWRFVAYWVFSSSDCVTSSARADATGSSAGVSTRRIVDSCNCVFSKFDCRVLSWLAPRSYIMLVLIRVMVLLLKSIADLQQRVEQLPGDLHYLAGGLVGLLVAQQVGRFLVEVDAGHALLRRPGLVHGRRCRRAAHLHLARLVAHVVDGGRIAALEGGAAAVQDVLGLQTGQQHAVAAVADTGGVGSDCKRVAVLRRARQH